MDIKLKLKQPHQKVNESKEHTNTEEATKTDFVMPFIKILGYNIFNPTEVKNELHQTIGKYN